MRSPLLLCFYLMMLITSVCNAASHSGDPNTHHHQPPHERPADSRSRKMLDSGKCSNRDISISQSRDSASGIPQYIVQIANTCVAGCAPSDVHLHCGWFASARIVNPTAFKRLSFDDCVVNRGRPLGRGQVIRFTYSNSFMYPLLFKSARFC